MEVMTMAIMTNNIPNAMLIEAPVGEADINNPPIMMAMTNAIANTIANTFNIKLEHPHFA